MAKTRKPKKIVPIKAKKKTFIEEVKTVLTNKGAYHVYLKLNDKSFDIDTDNLFEAIMSVKPSILKTALTIRITRNGKTVDRYMYLKEGRLLFSNKLKLESFIRNLPF